MSTKTRERNPWKGTSTGTALRIALTYVVFSVLWILLSDYFLELFVSAEQLTRVQSVKGSFFVLATGLFLFFLVRSALRRVEEQKNEADRYLRSLEYRSQFETLISEISTRFINLPTDEFDEGIHKALGEICDLTGSDAGYVMQFSQDGTTFSMTHLWQNGRLHFSEESQKDLDAEEYGWWVRRIRESDDVSFSTIDGLPSDAGRFRSYMESQGVSSLTDVPMRVQGSSIGFIGFATTESSRQWSEDEESLLGLAGQVFTNALTRRENESFRYRLEERLRQSQKLEAVGQLAGGVAHDFNNLLQAIQGYAELARMEGDLPETINEYLSEIREASDRARALVRQLLAFSRQESSTLEPVDLNEVVQGLLKMLRSLIGEHIQVDVLTEDNLWLVNADRRQAEVVLINLCVNARDAMPDGGCIKIRTRNVYFDSDQIEFQPGASQGKYVCLEVSDTGCGIPSGIQERVFEPFFTTKEVGSGTGLGLSTVYGILKQHDGLIDLESRENEGTVFRLYFPVPEHIRYSEGQTHDAQEAPSGSGETVLLAEDEATVRDLMVRILQGANYKVIVAKDGEEAIRRFDENRDSLSLALLDVLMPLKSGQAVRNHMRASGSPIPVLFCSGYSGIDYSRLLEDDGPCRLIQKPVSPNQLLREVRGMLGDA